ncbi:MAG: hypothetical protein LBB83_03170 [Treponema sp.]|nr:hypothetical protein [Treponema sp.]
MGIEKFKLDVEYDFIIPKWNGSKIITMEAFKTCPRQPVGLVQNKGIGFNPFVDYFPLWSYWYPGFITEVECGGDDVMSGPFSGCYFVKYRRDNADYVGHIGTAESSVSQNTLDVKQAWDVYAKREDVRLICGFNPVRHITPRKCGQKVFAIITSGNECYALNVAVKTSALQTTIVLLGKIKVTSLSPDELRNLFPFAGVSAGVSAGARVWPK